jgi:N-acetylgalactosamine kinase
MAGFKGLLSNVADTSVFEARGFDVLVDSDVPPGSGLSSSSALLCAATLALVHLFGLMARFTPAQLGEICAKAEHYVGSESGGMDQAISFLAQQGVAKHILFDPLRCRDVILPAGYSWVLINSKVFHSVADGGYNMRVSECRLAAALMAHHLGYTSLLAEMTAPTAPRKIRLIDILRIFTERQGRHFDPDADLTAALNQLSAVSTALFQQSSYSLAEAAGILGLPLEVVRCSFVAAKLWDVADGAHYKLGQRARHVFNEAARVYRFQSLIEQARTAAAPAALLQQIGSLLLESHQSCRDLFECSCEELDQVVALSMTSGALGCRLTGGMCSLHSFLLF